MASSVMVFGGLSLINMGAEDLAKVFGITTIVTERLHQDRDTCLMFDNPFQHHLPLRTSHLWPWAST
jgi:hypothetical protein